MQYHLNVSAILAAALLGSTAAAVAQTGEFVATVPGAVVHSGYALQDEWQNARNKARASQPGGAWQRPKPRQTELNEARKRRHDD